MRARFDTALDGYQHGLRVEADRVARHEHGRLVLKLLQAERRRGLRDMARETIERREQRRRLAGVDRIDAPARHVWLERVRRLRRTAEETGPQQDAEELAVARRPPWAIEVDAQSAMDDTALDLFEDQRIQLVLNLGVLDQKG